jgi:hypothetical protein
VASPEPVCTQRRDKKAGPTLREAARAHQSRPIVERIGPALVRFKTSAPFLPKSLLGEAAIGYALGETRGPVSRSHHPRYSNRIR